MAAESVFTDAAQVGRGQHRVRRLSHAGGDVRPRRAETRRGQSFLQREQGTQGIRRQVHGSVPHVAYQDGGMTSATPTATMATDSVDIFFGMARSFAPGPLPRSALG